MSAAVNDSQTHSLVATSVFTKPWRLFRIRSLCKAVAKVKIIRYRYYRQSLCGLSLFPAFITRDFHVGLRLKKKKYAKQ